MTDADRRRIHGPLRPADEDRGLSPFGKLLIAYCVLITAVAIGGSLYFTEPPAAPAEAEEQPASRDIPSPASPLTVQGQQDRAR